MDGLDLLRINCRLRERWEMVRIGDFVFVLSGVCCYLRFLAQPLSNERVL